MTLSDVDLAARLRDLGARADEIPPAPLDLADRVRARHRTLRRREIGLATAALAVSLVFVGVPIVASSFSANADRSHAAATFTPQSAPALADVPTRGSLARNQAWVAGVQQLSWRSLDERFQVPPDIAATLPDPAVADRTVAYAGDVPGGRVALVLSRTGPPAAAWFTGPEGADPEEMVLAELPSESWPGQPAVLEFSTPRTTGADTLVLVGWPGDKVDRLTSRSVSATGKTTEHWAPVPLADGAGAVTVERWGAGQPAPELRVHRSGRPVEALSPQVVQASVPVIADPAQVEVADPRGLRNSVGDDDLSSAIAAVTSFYVTPPEDLHPTLLAGGPVGTDGVESSVLVGFTFPSGATVASLVTSERGSSEEGGRWFSVTRTNVAPAGTSLMDRFFAVPGPNSLSVSGPASAVVAEVYGGSGTQLGRFPLTAGAGSGPVTSPTASATVRFLDARGAVVVQTALTGVDD